MGSIDTPCLLWDGYTRNGYGMVRSNGHQVYLHRLVMAESIGWEAIDGKVVMHLCDKKRCYRLDHLVIGTQRDNMLDMHAKGRDRNGRERDHCARGHAYDEVNTYLRKDRPGHRECLACRREATRRWKGVSS